MDVQRHLSEALQDLQGQVLIKIQDVQVAVAMSRAQIYKLCKSGRFPSPLRLGTKFSRWTADDIRQWLADPAGWSASSKHGTNEERGQK